MRFTINPPTVDYIVLTDAPGGAALTNHILQDGETITTYASGYNNSGPTYVDLVDVSWTDIPDLGIFDNTTGTSSTFTAGTTSGTTTITGQNATLSISDTFTVDVQADNSPPITTLTYGEPSYISGPDVFLNSSTEINLTATDDESGVASTWYRTWNGTAWSAWTLYAGNFTLEGQNGVWHMEYNSTDNKMNHETVQNNTLIMDNATPITAIAVGTPNTGSLPLYVNSTTNYTLSPLDTSGVAEIWYRTWSDSWSNWTLYNGSFSINGFDGIVYMEYNATDNLGQVEATKNSSFRLDNTPPATTLTVSGPNHGAAPIYFNASTHFNLTTAETGSGLKGTWYRVWNGTAWTAWTDYIGNFTITGSEVLMYIEYNATDELGQHEAVHNQSLILDSTVPTVSLAIGTPQYTSSSTYINPSTTITITADDGLNGSGAVVVEYWIDGGAHTNYTTPFTVTGEGAHTIHYMATDNLGQSFTGSLDVIVDDTAPEATMSFGLPSQGSDPAIVTTATEFNLTATDTHAGVASIWYSIDGSTIYNLYTGNFTLAEGTTHLLYRAVDNLGNNGTVKRLNVTVDMTPPATSISIINPQYHANPKFVNYTTVFNLTATDTHTGVASTWYKIGNGTWTLYTANFTLDTEGPYVIYYNSTDKMGNPETPDFISVYVDNTPPGIAVSEAAEGQTTISLTKGTVITLASTDTGVENETIYYSLDEGATWTPYTEPIIVNETITIQYYARDALGNQGLLNTLTINILEEEDEGGFQWWWLLLLAIPLILLLLFILKGRNDEEGKEEEKGEEAAEDEENQESDDGETVPLESARKPLSLIHI